MGMYPKQGVLDSRKVGTQLRLELKEPKRPQCPDSWSIPVHEGNFFFVRPGLEAMHLSHLPTRYHVDI